MTNIIGTAVAEFQDASLWKESKKKSDKAIKDLIEGLKNTSVTVVCVTDDTDNRDYINYEIDQSLAKGNGLVAVQIHHLKDSNGQIGSPDTIPSKIASNGFKAYKYTNKEDLASGLKKLLR